MTDTTDTIHHWQGAPGFKVHVVEGHKTPELDQVTCPFCKELVAEAIAQQGGGDQVKGRDLIYVFSLAHALRQSDPAAYKRRMAEVRAAIEAARAERAL